MIMKWKIKDKLNTITKLEEILKKIKKIINCSNNIINKLINSSNISN